MTITRRDREDLSKQLDAVAIARTNLFQCLTDLEDEAHMAARAVASLRGMPNMVAVAAANLAVEKAGEALDIAVYDLQTAGGEDG